MQVLLLVEMCRICKENELQLPNLEQSKPEKQDIKEEKKRKKRNLLSGYFPDPKSKVKPTLDPVEIFGQYEKRIEDYLDSCVLWSSLLPQSNERAFVGVLAS